MPIASTSSTPAPVKRSEGALGVMGARRIGRMHAELVARRLPGARLAAVCDADPRLAERAARELGAEVAGPASELIAGELDAVLRCSSTNTHPQLIEAAVAAGLPVL